ncbi:MAG: restriction endonuclease subunit S [Abditibacteriota bacterium]|nr:restriction endonuclease subunit S [Abditibacteriota bacterium]
MDKDSLDIFDSKEVLRDEYLARTNDIILRVTEPYTAVLIDESLSGMVVSSNFLIIRVNPQIFNPAYLLWLLNTPKVKHMFYMSGSGSMLSAINARIVSDYDTEYISIFDQQKIGVVYESAKREYVLLRRLADAKLKYNMTNISSIQKRMKGKNK